MSIRAADNTWIMHPQINNNGTFRWLLRAYGGINIVNINGVGSHGWDEWLHYAGTYDKATGKGILYINGEVVATEIVPKPPLDIAGDWGTGARVGYNIDNARPFTGLMDELYLFKRALSQAEIKALMASEGLPSEKASHPKPGNGTEIETTGTDLLWLPGAYAVSNNVYFGNNFEDVNNGTGGTFKGNQTEAQFTVAGLVWGTTYYWRIDGVNTVNPNSPWKGNVWSFLLRPQTAWNPNPPDGDKWVDPNADLSWSPGRGAVMHYVYFGDNFDVVNNAAGAPPQTQTTYDPAGTLGFEKVYYWRVDEFDGSATYKGNIWRFTTMRSGSGIKGQYYKDMELKALVLTRVDPGINFNWGAAAPDSKVPADNFSVRWTGELEAEFTEPYTFYATCDDCVRLWVNNKLLFDKWGQQSGVEWSGEINLIAGQKYSIVMEYYEITGDAKADLSWKSPSQPKQIIPQGAFSLPLWARNPKPPHGATDVKHTPKLIWVAGDKAVKHNVYFGTDETAVANATTASTSIYRGQQNLDATSYVPTEAPLQWNKTYYWRIDEVNAVDPQGLWKGGVWSFTTANFIVVDDFEDYTDDVGSRIFQTWRDGFGFTEPAPGYPGNGTGSAVGYAQAPFAEQTIVHGGGQSMPLVYDNSGTGGKTRYSETQREWASPQNWTVNNVKALTLYFYGAGANAAEQLYVAVEDNAGHVKVVNYPDIEAVQKASWQEWNIELTQFSGAGVNLSTVKKMYIGLGSRTSPKVGGTGTIFVDDIRVYRSRCIPSMGKPAADLSGNCIVDYADLDIMANEWLDKGVAVVADLDGDDDVDAKDFAILADAWLEEVLWP